MWGFCHRVSEGSLTTYGKLERFFSKQQQAERVFTCSTRLTLFREAPLNNWHLLFLSPILCSLANCMNPSKTGSHARLVHLFAGSWRPTGYALLKVWNKSCAFGPLWKQSSDGQCSFSLRLNRNFRTTAEGYKQCEKCHEIHFSSKVTLIVCPTWPNSDDDKNHTRTISNCNFGQLALVVTSSLSANLLHRQFFLLNNLLRHKNCFSVSFSFF